MDLTNDTYQQYLLRTSAARDLSALFRGTGPWDSNDTNRRPTSTAAKPDCISFTTSSSTNETPPDNTGDANQQAWRVDGATDGSRQILAVPVSRNCSFPPLRVDVFLPEFSNLSEYLYGALDCHACVHIRDGRFDSLGLAVHVRKSLQHWSSKFPDFSSYYKSLTFGTRICFRSVETNPTSTAIHIRHG
ncbi:hypothetical protein B0T21DRAFT_357626 [Apiosordaria backusii]|uniref:Uncharacterized protein n=1 Tax=Apiosordaria backusii TaxID=314023 RepID=A0AA40ERU8_9PEZI|nr:hypothetical protein B0T21DRAFT_357626 [Apiosordaria backusii]